MADEPSAEDIARVQKENCIFCRIIKGEIPSRKVYEDETVIAILDINPAAKGHILVMPKEHYPILPVIPPDTFKHTFRTAKYLMRGVREGIVAAGTTVFIANGAVAGQQSPHFLFHIVPRDHNDGLANFSLPQGKVIDHDKLTPALQVNMAGVMRQYLQREGLFKAETRVEGDLPGVVTAASASVLQAPVTGPEGGNNDIEGGPSHIDAKKTLAETILANDELRSSLVHEPEKIKELIKTDPELERLFAGINIDKLSGRLKEIEMKKQKKQEENIPLRPDLDKISRLFK